ncbi:MAG: hypothetical protein ACK5YR_17130 [Pirellula sp.]|jgi:hypothetical protein
MLNASGTIVRKNEGVKKSLRFFASLLCLAGASWEAAPLLGQSMPNDLRLAQILPSEADSYLAFRSSQGLERALADSTVGKQYREPKWQAIATKQANDGVGSFLNPQPWFGFDWKHLSGLDARGLLFSMKSPGLESGTVSALVFTDEASSQRFIVAWSKDAGPSGPKTAQIPLGANQSKVNWYTNPQPKSHLVSMGRIVLLSASQKHLESWLQDATARGVLANAGAASASRAQAEQGLVEFENGNTGDLRLWIKPTDFVSRWDKSLTPAAIAWKDAFLPSLNAASATVRVPQGGNAWNVRYQLQTKPTLTSAAKLLSLKSDLPIQIPPFDLSDAEAWAGLSVQMKDWFEGLSQSMNIAIDPKVPGLFDDMIDAVLTDPEGPRLDLKKDLFYRCSPSVAMASKSATSANQETIRDYLLVMTLERGVDANQMAQQLFEGDDVVVSEKLGEFSLWTTKNGEPLLTSAETESMNHMRAMACNAQYVVVCTSKDWLKSVLSRPRGNVSGLVAMHPAWAKEFGTNLGQPHSIMHGVDGRKSFRVDWESVKQVNDRSLFASVFIEAILGGTDYASKNRSMVPEWTTVQSAFGLMSHRARKGPNSLDGIFQIDSYGK